MNPIARLRPLRFVHRMLACALPLAALSAHAGDVTVQPAAGSGFVVTDATGASERLRVQESGAITLPGIPAAAVQATALCFGAAGQLGPCGLGGGASSYSAGTGLSLSGTTFSVAPTYQLPQGCSANDVAQWNGSAWTCAALSAGFTLPYSASQNYNGSLFNVTNTNTNDFPVSALRGETTTALPGQTTSGVLGVASGVGGSGGIFSASNTSGTGFGLYANSWGSGAAAYANAVNSGDAVFAVANGSGAAVRATSVNGPAGVFQSASGGPVLTVNAQIVTFGTNIAVFQGNGSNVARIDPFGKGYFNGGTQNSGADLAEFVPTSGTAPQPGDVVEIDPTQPDRFRLAAEAGTTRVAGVISTQPGVTLNAQQPALASTEGPALALAGRIPVKATNANGAIHIGDLLVASDLPGHAMRASATPAPGSVIGKALVNFDAADGVVSMLVWGH